MMHAVQDNAHALDGSEKGGNADQESNDGKYTPATASTAEGDEDRSDKTSNDAEDTKTTSEDDTRTVAVANSPADEVGV